MTSDPSPTPLTSAYADDPGMSELVELFVSELPNRMATLSKALDAQDFARLASLAHQLKGAGGGYGFQPISDASRQVEQLARGDAPRVEDLRACVDELADLCRRASAG